MQEYQMAIGGNRVSGKAFLDVVNPANGETFARVSRADANQVEQAVATAKAVQEDWAKLPMADRAKRLEALADALNARAEEMARILTQEQGKPLAESQFELAYTEAFVRHFATMEIGTEVVQDDEAFCVEVRRKPLGVVAAITPWNFPVLIPGFKIAMATVTGNTVVLKPSPTTPVSALLLGEICNEIFPAGVVNVIVDDNDLGPMLSEHADIAKVSFTGSVDTGKKVMSSASSTLKRITLELGGNDAGIVLPDVDVKETAQKIFAAAFMNCGQVCLALKRAYVPDSIYDEMCDELAKLADAAVVDDGLKQGTEIGPLQNQMQYEKVLGFLETAKEDGAIIAGGEALDRPGYFLRPTIVRDIKDGSRLVDEEQFGPILPVIRYLEGDDVVALANSSEFGLGGSVWSKDRAKAVEMAGAVEAGTVWVNQHLYFAPHIPFAGAKNSGIGVEFAKEGLEEFTQIQVINVAN
jgi:acyl-CoA reductase-like NAD-dependent aldehyde dehydrogenase